MSIEPITPLPTGASSEPVKAAPMPNLTSLRQGWGQQANTSSPAVPMENLPSLPTGQPSIRQEQAPTSKSEEIPALPELGAITSQADLTLDGLDHLLASVYPEQAKKSPSIQTEAGLEAIPAVPNPPTSSKPKHATDKIPLMEFPNPVTMPSKPEAEATSALDAMPVKAAANVSLPLARDQFTSPVRTQPISNPPEVTPPKDPRQRTTVNVEAKEKLATTLSRDEDPLTKMERASAPDPSDISKTSKRPDYTDEDLREALQPMIDQSVDKFLYTPSHGIHTYLEPMLRSTVRRAIAEQMDDVSPFQEAAGWDKFAWKMRALFSSRTYEEVLFEHTKRYQVEEVFLLRCHTRSLISYASNNPARHATTSKVQATVKKIASKCSSKDNSEADSFIKWEDNRHLMLRRGKHCILGAIINGSSNANLRSDLDYALRQAEERFGKSLEEENDIHLQILQPLLEGCLLIKAPAIPN